MGVERVVVVGAGVAGLSAAFRLSRAGAGVTVLERAHRVGGRIMTVRRGDYLIDAAASVLPTTYRHTLRLIRDAGLTGMTVPTSDLLGIARPEGVHRLHAGRPADLLRTGLLGARSKYRMARVLGDLYRHRAALADVTEPAVAELDRQSVDEYARKLLTDEAYHYFVQPLLGDFYFAPPEELSVVNLFLLLRTMLGARFFNSPQGLGFLPEGLAEGLDVELSATVTEVVEDAGGVTVTWRSGGGEGAGERVITADAAVVAVPAMHAPPILPGLDAASREYLASVPYGRTIVVNLALTVPPPEPAMWLTVPDRTHPDVDVVILDHNKAPGRVPPGAGLLTVYWQRDWAERHWDADDSRVVDTAVAEVRRLLPGIDGRVAEGHVWRWDPCAVARPVGGFRALAEFCRRQDPGARIQLAGDYFGITSVESSVASGERAAARLLGSGALGARLASVGGAA